MTKTTKEIIEKWNNLQLILIHKKGEEYSHETFEKHIWYSQSDFDQLRKELKLVIDNNYDVQIIKGSKSSYKDINHAIDFIFDKFSQSKEVKDERIL